jgi:predicted metalloendopeptidase
LRQKTKIDLQDLFSLVTASWNNQTDIFMERHTTKNFVIISDYDHRKCRETRKATKSDP